MHKLKTNEREFIARNENGTRYPYEYESICIAYLHCSLLSIQCSLTFLCNNESKSINFFEIFLKFSQKLFSLAIYLRTFRCVLYNVDGKTGAFQTF